MNFKLIHWLKIIYIQCLHLRWRQKWAVHVYIILYLFVCDRWGKVEKAKQKTAVTMAQVSAQQDAQKESNFALEMSEKSVSVI